MGKESIDWNGVLLWYSGQEFIGLIVVSMVCIAVFVLF